MTRRNTIYVVVWPSIRVVKVGYSGRKRWRSFQNRGAELLALKDFDDCTTAFHFEDACHMGLRATCRYAFQSASEAEPYLGNKGGGYLECFRIPGDLTTGEVLEYIDYQLESIHAQA
jgi:hypothetical protein